MTDPLLLTGGDRPAVRIERRFDHPIERVWRAVTAPEHLARWFPSEAEFELEPGGRVRFGGFEGAGASGEMLAVEPPRLLSFTWGGDRLDFELRAEDGGTVFVLTHHFDDRGGAASFATGWETCLAGLGGVLSGAEPAPSGGGVGRHEELVERFGLDEPEVSRGADGWRVRFERQLACPVETAWELFFGGGERSRVPGVGEEFRSSETLLGTAVEVDAPSAFALEVADGAPGDEVLLRLGEGTGHGARLCLEVRGGEESELEAAVERWGAGTVARLAHEAARSAA